MTAPSLVAITRGVSPRILDCELTHLQREPIDLDLARAQHAAYNRKLQQLGCRLHALPADPKHPDSVFVEDTAVVLDELAILARPGAPSRRGEVTSIAALLGDFRPLHPIVAPGTLDGGDVLVLGQEVFIGLSTRTNAAAVDQVRALLAPHGIKVTGVTVQGCLHLKSAACSAGPDTVLLNPEWIDPAVFTGRRVLEVDPREPGGAGALPIGDTVIVASEFPGTRDRLEAHGIRTAPVSLSELAKAEAGVTCCSLVFAAH